MRVLSGIQPTGKIHWGNYFGAIRQFINLQSTPDQAYYFVANLHALTTIRDKAVLEENTLGVVLDFLALGLDPNKATAVLAAADRYADGSAGTLSRL